MAKFSGYPLMTAAAALLAVSCASTVPPARDREGESFSLLPERMPDRLDIGSALSFAWNNHPAMKAAQGRIGSAHGAKVQAALWPRPELSYSYRGEVISESGSSISLSQKLELGGKRGARIAEADVKTFMRETEAVETWLELRAQLKRLFAAAAFAREDMALVRDISGLDSERERLSASIFAAGRMPEADYVDVCTKAEESAVLAGAAAERLADAERQALLAAGLPGTNTTVRIDADMGRCRAGLEAGTFTELRRKVVGGNPGVLKADAALLAARAAERLARASRWCDLRLNVERNEKKMSSSAGESGTGMGFGLAVDLPLWDRSQGAIASAKAEAEATGKAKEAVLLETESALSELLARTNEALLEEAAYAGKILPLAEKKETLRKGMMESGKISMLDYLGARRELQEIRRKDLAVRFAAVIALVELERIATGEGLE